MSDGEASTVASSIGLGDFGTVPGAAAGIAAALANAATPTNDRAGGAVATDEVSHEQLAAKLEEAEAVHRLMEGLLTGLEQARGGGGGAGAGSDDTDACLDPEFGVRMLDVATRAGNLWAPGTSGARAGVRGDAVSRGRGGGLCLLMLSPAGGWVSRNACRRVLPCAHPSRTTCVVHSFSS